ncbi:hypothetical protein CGLO_08270 [Colletotrichum gloeosporioides Cg-14]|uniref:Uncharacterized protein n=1 Tax=Colletotrichum gloeosporioides (strain Cg-14) TaxID=1237896 RepID=T0K9A3_COLGC|nr:hypothetical protein CGLO_08270 [Colletotrichum gloeosporioides Cg-14]
MTAAFTTSSTGRSTAMQHLAVTLWGG